MGSFHLGAMTLRSLFKKPETLCYPAQTKTPYAGQKGHIVNDVAGCILCAKCQKTCPCHCITVDKAARTWTIQPYMCVQCGSCVAACPTHCLSMDPSPTSIATQKSEVVCAVPEKDKDADADAEKAAS